MGVDMVARNETTEFCAAMLFLIVDLLVINAVIGSIIGQISTQQYNTNTMIQAHPTNAPMYETEGHINQGVWVIMGFAVLIFLAYISKEPIKKIKLIKDILKRK